jgi:hypothetical protein
VRKINVVVLGVNEIRKKSLCKLVDDCGKKNEMRESERQNSKKKKTERKEFYTEGAENTEGTEKIEVEKATWKVEKSDATRGRAEDQSTE